MHSTPRRRCWQGPSRRPLATGQPALVELGADRFGAPRAFHGQVTVAEQVGSMEFYKKRRQQFLTESAYAGTINFYMRTACPGYLEEIASSTSDSSDRWRNAYAYADTQFMIFMLKYTAGQSLEELRKELNLVVEAYELASKYVQEHSENSDFPPLRFVEIDEYERVLQMISLCFLLHRQDLLPRLAAIFDPSSAGTDTIYEDILAFGMEDRSEIDRWCHNIPYRDLVNCLYRDKEKYCIEDLKKYLKVWYTSFSVAPWYDSHLDISNDFCGGYFGYWSIEAAAIAYLLDVDDSSLRECMVYPRDLVDFARKFDLEVLQTESKEKDMSRLRVKGGGRCP